MKAMNEYNPGLDLHNISIRIKIGPITFNMLVDRGLFDPYYRTISDRHNHGVYELHFFTSGSGIMHIDDTEYVVSPDSYFFIKPGAYHFQTSSEEDPIQRYTLRFIYEICNNHNGEHFEIDMKKLIEMLPGINNLYFKNNSKNIPIILQIHDEFKTSSFGYIFKVKCLFAQILVNVFRDIMNEYKIDYKDKTNFFHKDRISIIESFFSDLNNCNATAADLCKILYVSSSQLNRIIKKFYSTSFKQKQLEVKIEYAKNLLENTDQSIRVVSEMAGYSSVEYFSKMFKYKTGFCPNSYRKLKNKL